MASSGPSSPSGPQFSGSPSACTAAHPRRLSQWRRMQSWPQSATEDKPKSRAPLWFRAAGFTGRGVPSTLVASSGASATSSCRAAATSARRFAARNLSCTWRTYCVIRPCPSASAGTSLHTGFPHPLRDLPIGSDLHLHAGVPSRVLLPFLLWSIDSPAAACNMHQRGSQQARPSADAASSKRCAALARFWNASSCASPAGASGASRAST